MEKVKTIDEYIDNCRIEYQDKLQKLRQFISLHIPNVEEKISWGMPTFYYKENIIHFALAKHHIGIYPGSEVIVAFEKQLENYKTSKGAIQIPLSQEMPYDLIGEIIEFRLKDVEIKG